MKITVTGATGNVGGRIVAQLVTGGHDVRAVIGPGDTPPWPARKGLEVTIASFSDRAAIEAAATGADAYFLMSPPSERQVEWQRTQVDAAVNSGVSRVVKLSAYDTGANSGWNMGRWHWDGELALQESGLPHAVLRPQYFQQNLLLDETTLRAGTLITYIPSGRSVGAVHAGDIADVAAALLTTAPVTITTDEAAAAISTALGTPISVDYVGPDRAWRELRAAGRPDWWIADLLAICQQASAEVNDDVAALSGHPATSIADTAREQLVRATVI